MKRTAQALVVVAGIMILGRLVASSEGAQEGTPQEQPYLNVQVLGHVVPRSELTFLMQIFARSLGVRQCEPCHVRGGWELDDNPRKKTARNMIHMVSVAGTRYFEGIEAATCWTCHRGSTTPRAEVDAEMMEMVRFAPTTAFPDDDRSAREVYENLEQFGDIPARQLRDVMQTYSASLGVGCTHCHVSGDWASDEKFQKRMARRMHEIRTGLQDDFFDSRQALSCWTCHQGQPRPETNLPRELMPPRQGGIF